MGRRNKRIFVSLAVFFGLLVLLVAAAFFFLQSPAVINRVSAATERFTGYAVHVDHISLDRRLQAKVQGLQVRSVKDDSLRLSLAAAEVKGKLSAPLRIEVETIVLEHPKFTYHLKKTKEKTNVFAALEKLPPVKLLSVKDGELELKTGDSRYSVPGVNLTVENFSPKTGGDLRLEGRLKVDSPGASAAGAFEGSFKMARFSPDPSGRGSIRLSLASASIGPVSLEKASLASAVGFEGEKLSFERMRMDAGRVSTAKGAREAIAEEVQLKMDLAYDQRSSRFTLTSLEGRSLGLGSLEGRCEGTINPFSWVASFNADSVDLPRVFTLARPFLPEEYRSWTFKGKGGLEMRTEGRMDDPPVWKADALVDLKEGGFASGDNLKAGERISGKIRLKLSSPGKEKKGEFNVAVDAGEGELLWGKYYRNFKGETMSVTSEGSFAQSPFSLSCSGKLDLFRSGDYSFSADLSPAKSVLTFQGKNISHPKMFTLVLSSYLREIYPDMQEIDVSGHSDFLITATASGEDRTIEGLLTVHETGVNIPSRGFALAGLQLSLPFDFRYPPAQTASALDAEQGSVSFERLEKGKFAMGKLEVPLLLSRNTLLVPVQVDIPLYGGDARLTHFRVDRLLSPEVQVHAGLSLEHVDLGTLTEKLSPIPVNGTIEGALTTINCQGGQCKTRGRIVAKVFGGQIEVQKIFGRNLFSRGRSFGGDVRFDDIDLEAVTSTIEVGKITGIIKGAIKDLTFEYGQPSEFVLDVETDTTKRAPRRVSVEAIENLSIIGTGSSAISSVLNSGINKFFKSYPYSRIGISCTLHNDVFSLRGTIHEGGKEYLIRRAFLRGIDIINQNPQNSISFKDMQERLSRIFRPRQETENVS
ncbi:MAG: hypothetical protein A4E57_00699 [Syntrophorhabdaceae bacterium PtaU1.Bin034]|nr:MAG: hypothetical protein A4E57_00699 [Syntrophorhabdaceae bacterium PtaU1.Bin034]